MPDQEAIQGTLLKAFANRSGTLGVKELSEQLAGDFPEPDQPSEAALQEAFWRLVSLGLAFPVFGGTDPVNVSITSRGKAAASDALFNPDFPPKYLERLRAKVPNLGDPVERYVREALRAFEVEAFLASAVMLGVASEGATLELAESFAEWLDAKGQDKLKKMLAPGKESYATILQVVRTRLASNLPDLPDVLGDGLDAKMALADILRGYRNEAGHPTGKTPSREESFETLVLFPAYAERVYGLNAFFQP